MATDQELRGQWRQVRGAVREKYGEITDDEIQQTEGSAQKLIGLIQEKTGQSQEQVEAFVHEIGERARAGYEYSTQAVAERPAESVLAAFTIGMVVGLAIGVSIVGHRRPEPSWHNRLWS